MYKFVSDMDMDMDMYMDMNMDKFVSADIENKSPFKKILVY